jgi:hypothetical protein
MDAKMLAPLFTQLVLMRERLDQLPVWDNRPKLAQNLATSTRQSRSRSTSNN